MTFNNGNAQPPAAGWLFPLDDDDAPAEPTPGAFDDESPYIDEYEEEQQP